MNLKTTALTLAILSTLCLGNAFAKEPAAKPQPVPLQFTQEQWDQLKAMNPMQRMAAFENGIRTRMANEKMSTLSAEQRAEVEQFIKDCREHRKAMQERFNKMSPEQKEALRLQMPPKMRDRKAGPGPQDGMQKDRHEHGKGHHGEPQGDKPGKMPPCPPDFGPEF